MGLGGGSQVGMWMGIADTALRTLRHPRFSYELLSLSQESPSYLVITYHYRY